MHKCIVLYGILTDVLINSDIQFVKTIFDKLCTIFGTSHQMMTLYHLQTSRKLERINKIKLTSIRHYVVESSWNSNSYLQLLAYLFIAQVHHFIRILLLLELSCHDPSTLTTTDTKAAVYRTPITWCNGATTIKMVITTEDFASLNTLQKAGSIKILIPYQIKALQQSNCRPNRR